MPTAQELKSAGFNDEEIGQYVSQQAKTLTDAGFKSSEISDYLGVQPSLANQPKARKAQGLGDAWSAGYQRSLAGLIDRGKLPDVEIDPHHNDWLERNVANVSQMFNEAPEMIAAGVAGFFTTRGAKGSAFAAGYAPAVIRTAYADAIRDGAITDSTGFWKGTTIVAPYLASANAQKQGLKEGAVNALTVGAGQVAGKLAAPYVGPAGVLAAATTAEYATAVTAPAAMEGRLPEPHEWLDGATQVLGPKIAAHAAPKVAGAMMETWRRTGIPPEQQVRDAAANPSIREDLARGTSAEEALRAEVKKQGVEVQEIDPDSVDLSMFEDAAAQESAQVYRGVTQSWEEAARQDIEWWAPTKSHAQTYAKGLKGTGGEIVSAKIDPSKYETVLESEYTIDKLDAVFTRAKSDGLDGIRVVDDTGKTVMYATFNKPKTESLSGQAGRSAAADWKAPADPTEPAAVQQGKSAARAAVATAFQEGRIPERAAYRGLSVEELKDIADTGELKIGRNAEGEAVTAASPVDGGKIDGAVYGAGSGYIVPRERTTASGMAGEVHVDPRTNPRDITYVVNGKLLSFDEMKAEVLGPSGKRPKSAEDLAAEAWLREQVGDALPPEIPRAYQAQAAKMAAQEAFPGEKAKQVLNSPFAELPETKLPHQLNLKHIEAPEDIKALYTRMSEVYRDDIQYQRNGRQSWADTDAKARSQISGLLGPDAKRILEGRNPGDPVSTVELQIRADMLMQATVDASSAIEAWKSASIENRPGAEAAAVAAVYKLSGIQAELIGARAEAARALQIAKVTKVVQEQTKDVGKMVELYGKDPALMLQMLSDMGSPEALSNAAKAATKQSWWGTFIDHYYRPGLMSGFLTVGYNIAGNTSRMLLRNFAVEPVAAIGNLLRSPENRTTTMSDVAARWYGTYYIAPRSMIRAAADAFQHDGVTGPAKAAWEAGQQNALNTAPAGKLGAFSRAVYGTNSMLDTMFRELNTQGALWSEATSTALKEGQELGTQAFTERVRELVANPTDKMLETAQHEATASVFATPGGKILQAYNKLADAAPVLNFLIPFRQTPANMFKDMARLTPFAPLIDTWQTEWAAGGARRDRAIAEMAVGGALMAAGVTLAMEGKLTGGGDPDPKKRAAQLQSGWQPYSYKMSDGTYVPLVKIAPQAGTLLGMTADMVQLQQYMTPEEQHRVGQASVLTFKNAVTNQTMLAGITNVLKAMDDEHSFERYVNSTAGSLVPASGMMGQIAAVKDPYQREVYTMLDAMKNRVPVARETLQPKIDAWGEKIKELERPLVIAPIKPSKESDDRVRTEAARLGVSVSKPPKTLDVGLNAGRVGMVELTPEQKTKYAETAGKLAYQIMAPQVSSPVWDRLPDTLQREAFQDALTQGRELANATTLTPDQLREEVRVRSGRLLELLQFKEPK